ncbi:hypothetical protein CBR_g927 [Chara braunii]|uniref:Uncharacterized protein n=1 Tax=Chara braunii TaxID=69332 RepID=A0A388KCY1_CHABU|nr:hypothetical protein CBR_g927 [Chara braunii]|eukprot:GBG67803.1 hypothetical protein CBR_g927 [Chara braunii]
MAQYSTLPAVEQQPVKAHLSTPAPTMDPLGKYTLKHQGAFSAVEAIVAKEDGLTSLKAVGRAMVTMHNNVDLRVELEGGMGQACCRCCCAGSSAFLTHFFIKPELPPGTRGDVLLAPSVPGETILLHLQGSGDDWIMQKGAFLACDPEIEIGVHTQGVVTGCFGGEGIFVLRASGRGRLLVSSFGSIIRYDLGPGEVRKIDNGALVAWQSHMDYTVGKASRSLFATIFSSEGFVTRFTGPGTVFAQTRTVKGLADAIAPYLPYQSAGGDGGAGADAGAGSG